MIIAAIAWERDQPGELTIVAITAPGESGAYAKTSVKHLASLFRRAVADNDHELSHRLVGALVAAQGAPYAIMSPNGQIEVSKATTFGEFLRGVPVAPVISL